MSQRIAVIGAGVAGLTCAYLLDADHEVEIFEAADYLGGHTNTIDVTHEGRDYAVDTGFIVHNDKTYPHFVTMMKQLDVPRQDASMSFSVRCEQTGMEYNGDNLNALFVQRRNLFKPRHWLMIKGILDFNKLGKAFLEDPEPALTLGQFLERHRVPESTIRNYVMPMGAAVWSTPLEQMKTFPALFFLRFFENHGFLNVKDRPQWRTIPGGCRTYVQRMAEKLRAKVHLSTPIREVRRGETGVRVVAQNGTLHDFDQIILAVHSDQALRMLAQPTDDEARILGAIPYTENMAYLHYDETFQPRKRGAWASWNYHLPREDQGQVTVTYNMNILQSIEAPITFLVSLNPHQAIDQSKVFREIQYHHPLYTLEGMRAQEQVGDISGADRIHYCGAWRRYGFHEDGVWSAVQVCRHFGKEL